MANGKQDAPLASFRPDIEGLRAIAVLAVVLFHAFPDVVRGGFLGVDVFFVISGYLITAQIGKDLDGRRWSLFAFYGRRIRRLFPAFVVCIATVTLVGAIVLLPSDFEALAQMLRGATLGYANHAARETIDYFGLDAAKAPLLHIWSLSVEEQFYILLPVVLWGAQWAGRSGRLWACLGLGAVSLAAALLEEPSEPGDTFYLMPYRAWELLAGAVIAHLPAWRARPSVRAPVAGLALILILVVVSVDFASAPPIGRLLACAGAGLLILANAESSGWGAKLLAVPPMQWIGRASYSIYLWHWPVLVFAGYVAITPLGPTGRLLAVSAALVLGFASWRFVEVPGRRGPWPLWRYLGSGALAASMVAAALIIGAQAGVPERLPTEVVRLAAFADDRDQATFSCRNPKPPFAPTQLCHVGAPEQPADWVIWGDSHAWALQGAFSQWLATKGQAGVVVSYFGCPPVIGVTRSGYHRDCRSVAAAALSYVERVRPRNVVIVSMWTDYLDAPLRRSDDTPGEASTILSAAIGETVQRLNATGARVWIMDPMPQARTDVPSALARASHFGTTPELAYTKAEYVGRNRPLLAAFDAQGSRLYGRISPQAELCRSGTCLVLVKGHPLYFDYHHVAFSQTAYMAGVIGRTARGPIRPGAADASWAALTTSNPSAPSLSARP